MQAPNQNLYEVRQATSPAGEPLGTFHIFCDGKRVMAFVEKRRVQHFFSMRKGRPARDESRWPQCSVCNVAIPEEAPRHAQTPDGRVTRFHRWVSYR